MAKNSNPLLQDALKGYWVGKKLGTGALSEVYSIKRHADGKVFAAKFIGGDTADHLQKIRHLENEFRTLQALHAHKSEGSEIIVRAVEFQKVKKFFKVRGACLIMEMARGRSLDEFRQYKVEDVLAIFRQVCLALEHMHKVGYVHADLKPANILVGKELKVTLIDFGFAAPVGQELKAFKGTVGYLAPEQTGGRLTEKTDVYNLGAAIYWVLTGRNVPSIAPGRHEARGFVPDESITIPSPSLINPDVPDELSDMVVKCCTPNEHLRPTVKQFKQYMHGLQLRIEYGAV